MKLLPSITRPNEHIERVIASPFTSGPKHRESVEIQTRNKLQSLARPIVEIIAFVGKGQYERISRNAEMADVAQDRLLEGCQGIKQGFMRLEMEEDLLQPGGAYLVVYAATCS